MFEELLRDYGGTEVSAMDVYRDMFHLGEGMIQKEWESKGLYKANPLIYYRNNDEGKGRYKILFEDTFEEVLLEGQKADFCILNGITYFGRKNLQSHAGKMFALIFDLDGISEISLKRFLHGCNTPWFDRASLYPKPNYIILSGWNVHLYYLFETPVELYPTNKTQIKDLKYALIDLIWNQYTSNIERKQFQGINQGFRVIGGKAKAEGRIVRAFHLSEEHYSIDMLNQFVPEKHQMKWNKYKDTSYSLEEAKKKFPKWYKRVIEENAHYVKKWEISEKVHGSDPYALYHWWIRQLKEGATFGHRYFCIMVLTIYAVKCDVPFEVLKADAYDLIPYLNAINEEMPFTEMDVESALECFDDRYCTFPIKDIEKLSSIEIERNKRNFRKQDKHLKLARFARDLNYDGDPEGWINKEGRPKGSGRKQMEVQAWKKAHPAGRKIDCIRDTGLSKQTVYKWWGRPVQGVKKATGASETEIEKRTEMSMEEFMKKVDAGEV